MKNLLLKVKIAFKSLLEFAFANKITTSIVVGVLILDQITKYLARNSLVYGNPVNILGDFLRFTLVFNRGVSFGIFNSTESTVIHALLPFLVVGIILFLVYIFITISKEIDSGLITWVKVSFGLIWGGAFGNLTDRIFFSYVTDFIDVGIGNIWRFYIFNVADSCITIGTLLIIFVMIYSDIVKGRKEKQKVYEDNEKVS